MEKQLQVETLEFKTEDLDNYFARIGRCGGSEQMNFSVNESGNRFKTNLKPTESHEVLNEKDITLNLLANTSLRQIQKQETKKPDFVAIPVTISVTQISFTREQTGTKLKDEESGVAGNLSDVKRLPSNRLPWPLLDMDVVIAQGQDCKLDDIFQQMTTANPPGPQITMKYEILRLCTYRHFPDGNKPYSIRLAGAGFYYAGKDDELTCYCCGLRKSGWSSEDIPVLFHERTSPGCSFVKKIPGVNIPVPHPQETRPNRLAIFDVLQESAASEQATASASALVLPEARTNSLVAESAKKVAEENRKAVIKQTKRRPGNMAYQTTSHPLQHHNLNQTHFAVSSHNEATIQRSGLGIDYEKPKHPQYSVKAVRMQSYLNWPSSVHQTPHELAEAGMYYAGFGDCVRCFFCGIGLRHWSEEDNPWIEHARWSPRCVYLRHVKGDEFVDLVQLAVQYNNEEDEDIPGNPRSSPTSGTGREHFTAASIMENILELEEAETASKLQREMETMTLNSSDTKSDQPRATEVRSNAEQKETVTHKKVDTKKILQQNKELKEQTLCKICLDNPVCIVFLPCGHLVTCAECAPAMRKCPICRAIVKGTVKTYMA